MDAHALEKPEGRHDLRNRLNHIGGPAQLLTRVSPKPSDKCLALLAEIQQLIDENVGIIDGAVCSLAALVLPEISLNYLLPILAVVWSRS